MLQLNGASENSSILRDAFQRADKMLKAMSVRSSKDVNLERLYKYTAWALYIAGMEAYRFEKPAKMVCELLVQSSRNYILMYGARKRCEAIGYYNPWDFLKICAIVVCFGKRLFWKGIKNVDVSLYCQPILQEQERLVAFLETLKGFLSTGSVDLPKCEKLILECRTTPMTRLEDAFLAPQIAALCAIASGDEFGWNSSLEEIIHFHEAECKSGDYQLSPDGYISLPALMMAAFGKEKGMHCKVSSIYLPLDLLVEFESD